MIYCSSVLSNSILKIGITLLLLFLILLLGIFKLKSIPELSLFSSSEIPKIVIPFWFFLPKIFKPILSIIIFLLKNISPSNSNSWVPIIKVSNILLLSSFFFTFSLLKVIIDKFEFLLIILCWFLSTVLKLFKCNKLNFEEGVINSPEDYYKE